MRRKLKLKLKGRLFMELTSVRLRTGNKKIKSDIGLRPYVRRWLPSPLLDTGLVITRNGIKALKEDVWSRMMSLRNPEKN